MRLLMALVSSYLARQAWVQPLGCWVPSDVTVPHTEHIYIETIQCFRRRSYVFFANVRLSLPLKCTTASDVHFVLQELRTGHLTTSISDAVFSSINAAAHETATKQSGREK